MTIEMARPEWNYLSHNLLIDPGVAVQWFFVLRAISFCLDFSGEHERTNNVVSEQL